MKKVLVINDDPDFQYLMKSYLERQGYIAHIINDDEPVLPKIEIFKPDLIVLDIEKERDKQICKMLQKHEKARGIRLVVLADQDNPLKLDCEPDAIIRKPFEPTVFIKKINSFFI